MSYVLTGDEDEAVEAVEGAAADVVFFDTVRLGTVAFGRMRAGRAAVGLSPIFDRLEDLDLVFHRTRALSPALHALAASGRLRAGLEYAVVRPACERIGTAQFERALAADRLGVAVSMGGGDAGNLTLRTLRALVGCEEPLLIWCLLGEGYGHCYNELAGVACGEPRHEIILAKTSDSMWRVLGQCGLAVLAGGTVTYEAAYAGLPAVNRFPEASHEFLASELIERGGALSAGDSDDRIVELVRALERDRGRLLAMHRRSRSLLDGRGAERIVAETRGLIGAETAAAQEAA